MRRCLDLKVADFAALLASLGTPVSHPFIPAVDTSHPTVRLVRREADKVGAFIYGGAWHQNLMFLADPPDMTCLLASHVTDPQNYTAFVDLVAVRPWLSDGLIDLLANSRGLHSTTAPLAPSNAYSWVAPLAEEIDSYHPCLVTDDATGHVWPFVYSNYVVNLEGWHKREAEPLIEALRAFAVHEEFVIRHYWRPGDLLIWDNRRYMHRATVTHTNGPRELWRGDVTAGWGLTSVPSGRASVSDF